MVSRGNNNVRRFRIVIQQGSIVITWINTKIGKKLNFKISNFNRAITFPYFLNYVHFGLLK